MDFTYFNISTISLFEQRE